MPELSLIVANRDNERWLKACLESINQQSIPQLRVILVDDASTDSSLSIMESFAWRNGIQAEIVRLENQVGVSEARNLAYKRVSTSYITQIDSDDFYLSRDKLLQELNLASSGPGRIGFSRIVRVDSLGNPLERQPEQPIEEGELCLQLLRRSCMIPRDFVVSLELYERAGGYDKTMDLYEDWDLKLRLAQFADFRYTGLDGTAYRQHGSGLSSAPHPRHKEAQARVVLKNLKLYENKLTLSELCDIAKALKI